MRNLLFTLMVGLSILSHSQTYLLQEDFDNGYSDWTSASNSGNIWGVYNAATYAHSGNNVSGYQYHTSQNADAYFFFSALYLDAGTSYDISFWQRVYSSSYPEKFELTVGTSNTIAAQSTTVHDWGQNNNATYTQRTTTYTPTTSGIYYFAIHCYSDANEAYLFVDDVTVSTNTCKNHSCSAPSNISSLPYSASNLTTCGNCDNYSSADACGSTFMDGSEYVFTYTPASDGWVDVQLTTAHDGLRNGAAVFLLDNCPNSGANCLASSTVQYPANHGSPHIIFDMDAGQTYYIVVANDPLTTYNTHGCIYFDIDVTNISHPTPTAEDCFGAQPICGSGWHENTPGNGQGGFPSEINSSTSCLEGERNGTWYSFTVESSGTIQILIDPDHDGTSGDPNDNADDYDFALYNVTNAGCEGIFDGSSPEVACNYEAVHDGEDGNTGVNSSESGSNDSFEPDVNVVAGETYMLYISQWSVSTNGFTITLGGTADYIDNDGPELTNVDQPLCGENTVTVYFSESIDCSQIDASDFNFTNPNGLTITGATSPLCDAGGSFTNDVILTLSGPITEGGTYTVALVDGSIADVCGHTNPAGSPSVSFTIVTPTPNITGDNSVCANDAGEIYSTTNNSGNTYSWSTSSGTIVGSTTNNSASINWGAATTATVSVTETISATGCSSEDTYTVTINPLPNVAASNNSAICDGEDLYLFETGNEADAWTWTGPNSFTSTDQNPTIVGATTAATGTYSVTGEITATGCENTVSTSVTINPLPNVTASSDDADNAICDGYTITLTGGGADSYSWDNSVNDGSAFIPTGTQTYTVTGQNSSTGCENTAQITITVNPLPNVFAGTNDTITWGSSTTIDDASPSGLTYSWEPADSLVNASVQNPTTVNLYSSNTFTLTGTNANGCENSSTVQVVVIGGPLVVDLNINPDDSICYGDTIAISAITSGASGNYTFNWSSNQGGTFADTNIIVVSPTVNTNYYIEVVDGVNTAYDTISIIVNPLPVISSVTATDLQCNGDDSGEINISATGSGTLSYSINDGIDYYTNNGLFSNMSVGTGFITVVEDGFGCIAYGDTVDISQPTPLSINISSINDATCGLNNGNITLTSSGGTFPYNYVWSSGQTPTTDSTNIDLVSGDYIVTITDSHDCEDTIHYFIDNLGGGTVDVTSINDANCYNENSGAFTATITGGTPSFTYYLIQGSDTLLNLSSNDSTITIDTLLAGSYSIVTQEGVGCISNDTFTINQPSDIILKDSLIDIRCYGDYNGEIYILAEGGTPGYTYLWSTTETGSHINNLSAGSYSVVVTDNNGCTKTKDSLWLHAPSKLIAQIQIDNFILCYNDSIGSLTAVADSGTAPYTYLWNNSETTATINNLTAGNYSVTVFDDHGCTVEIDTSLNSPTQIIVNDSIYSENYYGVIATSAIGGVPSYSYLWSNGATDSIVSYLVSGDYYLTVTDANNCNVTMFYNIDIPLIIPSVITPNADGKNDYFRITNIASAKEVDIKIFNRWGDVIFEYSGTGIGYDDNSKQWDGYYNGKELPMGSYVYIVDLKNDKDPYTGTVTIVR